MRTRPVLPGSGRRNRTLICCFKGSRPAVSRSPNRRVPCGSRTRLAGLEGRRLCRSAKGTCRVNASCGGRNRTCVGTVNSRLPVPARAPPQCRRMKSARSDLNRRSRAPEARGLPGFPTRRSQERPAGVEPARPPWQGDRLPLHHGRFSIGTGCQRTESKWDRRDLNPYLSG
jgi:hypothetical protein